MNWARGFYRVWVVFAFLWIGVFANNAYWSRPYFPSAFVAKATDGSIKIVSNYGADADGLKELESLGKLVGFEADGFPELTFFAPKDAKKETLRALTDFAKTDRDEKLRKHHSDSIWEFLSIGLGFPLGLLAMGAALGWALGGFRKSVA